MPPVTRAEPGPDAEATMIDRNSKTERTPRLPVAAVLLASSALGTGCAGPEERAIVRYGSVTEGAYAIVADVRAKPGKEDELRAATLPLVDAVRREPNNLLYFLHEDRAVPGRFVFYEIFASSEDFESHNASPHVQAWFAKLPELADGNVTVERLKILGH
jgi:quinol monooxygenase YgiN